MRPRVTGVYENSVGGAGLGGTGKVLLLHLRALSSTGHKGCEVRTLAGSDVSRRKWLIPGAEHSIFTGQPLDTRDSKADSHPEDTCLPGYHSPLEKDPSPGSSPTSLLIKKQRDTSDTPIMKALKEFDEEKVFKNWGTQTEKEDTSNTKREIMLTPVTVAYSPKRSPKENLSPGFSHLLSKNESSPIRFDILLDDLDTVPVSTVQRPNPRKQLQFLPLDDSEEKKYSERTTDIHVNHSSSPEPLPSGVKKVPVRSAWEKNKSVSYEQCKPACVPPQGNDFEYTAKIRTLAETERFFDELTKEKDQIEAALSRMPSTGGRITLQTRLNQVKCLTLSLLWRLDASHCEEGHQGKSFQPSFPLTPLKYEESSHKFAFAGHYLSCHRCDYRLQR
ncbi:M-phase phosphoprotein 9, partial [Eschrichtius robustus]|nr:M-phase phosphoprotein 9 [Eschrichtius robustus]